MVEKGMLGFRHSMEHNREVIELKHRLLIAAIAETTKEALSDAQHLLGMGEGFCAGE